MSISNTTSQSSPRSRPDHHVNSSQTAFQNPWPSAGRPTWSELLQMSTPLSWSEDLATNPEAKDVNVVPPDWGAASLNEKAKEQSNYIVGTWLGHASTMVQLPIENASREGEELQRKSLWILFDPIFSIRAGPTQWTGPRRLKPPPCQVESLPACDAVVISHNHYDHLDLGSIQSIVKKFPKCKYFVPLGNKSWFTALGIPDEMVYELDWWQECTLRPTDFHFESDRKEQDHGKETSLRFTAVPAQHTSGRGVLDQNSTLWCGWAIQQILSSKENQSLYRHGGIYYAGDTGLRRTSRSKDLCPTFNEIGRRFGPFDLSFIPIWRGGSFSFISSLGIELNQNGMTTALHVTPNDAMCIHKAVKSRNTVPIHFGTFVGTQNEVFEATVMFSETRKKEEVCLFEDGGEAKYGRAGILDIGGNVVVEIKTKELSQVK